MFRRRKAEGPDLDALLVPGEMVTVRAYAGSRADEEPRAIVVGDTELAVESIEWRAIVEDNGTRSRVFVVKIGGRRVRLAIDEDVPQWEIQRVWAPDRAPDE